MSGQLVGEVIAAAPQLHAVGLSPNGFHALIAIAEKCHHVTRQAPVRREWIQAAIYGSSSSRSAERAVRELRDLKLIDVLKRGYKAPNGEARASTYRLMELPPPRVADADTELPPAIVAGADPEGPAKSVAAAAKPDQAAATRSGGLDGYLDGYLDGGTRARERTSASRNLPDPANDPQPNPFDSWTDHAPGGAMSPDERRFHTLCAKGPVEPPKRQCAKHAHWEGPHSCHTCGGDKDAYRSWHASVIQALSDLKLLADNTHVPGLPIEIAKNRKRRLALLDALGLSRTRAGEAV